MSFKEQLESGKFVVVAELQPPKGNDLSELYQYAELLKGRVDAINVPDLQNAIMRLGSLSVCSMLKAKGLEVIFNLSCSDRNRLALQSDLLNASALGLNNVLLLHGMLKPRERLGVLRALIEEPGIGCFVERLFLQSVKFFVHVKLSSPRQTGSYRDH